MIYLLFSSFDDLMASCRSLDPAGLFGPQEREELAKLHIPARIAEWTAGRIAAKVLLRRALPEYADTPFPATQLLRDSSGAPYLAGEKDGREPGSFSLSHSHGYIFAGYRPVAARFGLDLEFIEPRSDDFIGDYFSENEISFLRGCAPEEKYDMATLIWSAKEAALKAASLGLRLDTRRVEISLLPNQEAGIFWRAGRIDCSEIGMEPTAFYWRRQAGFFQTLCVDLPHLGEIIWVDL